MRTDHGSSHLGLGGGGVRREGGIHAAAEGRCIKGGEYGEGCIWGVNKEGWIWWGVNREGVNMEGVYMEGWGAFWGEYGGEGVNMEGCASGGCI